MSEQELDCLLTRGIRRRRLVVALNVALVALSLALVAAAAAIFRIRYSGGAQDSVPLVVVAPFVIALIAGAWFFARRAVSAAEIARDLDRRAGTREHLLTWLHLRTQSAPTSELATQFRDAQRAATLRLAPSWDARRLLPITLPDWSRAVWLAVLLLLCALLMPPRPAEATTSRAPVPTRTDSAAGKSGGRSERASDAPRVEILSPTDLRRLQMIATDGDLSAALKKQALKELLDKAGGIPESELSPEVRELLNMLRRDAAPDAVADKNSKAGGSDGSSQHATEKLPEAPGSARAPEAAVVPAFTPNDKTWTQIREQFPDVQAKLEQYYKGRE